MPTAAVAAVAARQWQPVLVYRHGVVRQRQLISLYRRGISFSETSAADIQP